MKARLALGGAVVAVGLGAGVVEYVQTRAVTEALEAFLAGGLAVGLAAYALSLPGLDRVGLALGGFFVAAGILSWSYTDNPIVVWSVLAVEGVVFAALSYPWVRDLPGLRRLGGAWLGLAYWALGVVGALLGLHAKVAAQRLAYLAVFAVAALTVVVWTRRRDLTVGIVSAFLVAIAVLLLAGSGNLFDATHAVPANGWGTNMQARFWGGPALLYHPNSLALIAVVAAIRIAPDPAFARWQRLVALGIGGAGVFVTNSRTGFVFAFTAAAVHAFLVWRRREPAYGRPWLAVAAPFLVLLAVLVLSGGKGFVFQERYAEGGLTSGRADTWRQVAVEWRSAPVVDKIFGDTKTARAVVRRDSSGDVQLTTDNAAVGALRRGGVLGVAAFLLGLYLLLRHALWGRRGPAWFTIAAVAALPTIATADWLLGGTGGTLWILLLAAEASVLLPVRSAEPVPV